VLGDSRNNHLRWLTSLNAHIDAQRHFRPLANEDSCGPNCVDSGEWNADADAGCQHIKNAPPSINGARRETAAVESEILVPGILDAANELSKAEQAVGSRSAAARPSAPSIVVDRPKRTTAPRGITGYELKRLSGALHLMKKQAGRAGQLWLLSTDNGGLPRSIISEIQKRVGRYQRDADLAPYYFRVMETRSNTHAHVVFIGTGAFAARLTKSDSGKMKEPRQRS
jgi:hypothetical protein